MSKTVTWYQNYDCPPQQALEILMSEEFQRDLAMATGSLEATADVQRSDDGRVTLTSSRTMPAQVPGYAKAFVGESIELVEIQRWDPPSDSGERTGTFEVKIDAAPVRFDGTLALTGSTTCQVITTGEVKASVPLVGGKIEGLIAEQIGRYIEVCEKLGQSRINS